MRFRVLGSVDIVSDDGQVYTLNRRQERGVLAILLLEAGRVVPVDQLCERRRCVVGSMDALNRTAAEVRLPGRVR
jgi:hypothetical protein